MTISILNGRATPIQSIEEYIHQINIEACAQLPYKHYLFLDLQMTNVDEFISNRVRKRYRSFTQSLRRDIDAWCSAVLDGGYKHTKGHLGQIISFELESDKLMFMLRWGGEQV